MSVAEMPSLKYFKIGCPSWKVEIFGTRMRITITQALIVAASPLVLKLFSGIGGSRKRFQFEGSVTERGEVGPCASGDLTEVLKAFPLANVQHTPSQRPAFEMHS